jgi:hypothetical protein
MNVAESIARADALLPGIPAPRDKRDHRWQAIIKVATFIHTNPEEVWQFVERWGRSKQADVRGAIATCVLEHILESHFEEFFPRAAELARRDRRFADTLQTCFLLGRAKLPQNREAFEKLVDKLSRCRKSPTLRVLCRSSRHRTPVEQAPASPDGYAGHGRHE